MSADVVCMSLANVPPGEQRTRFLAVGLVDNTVRIISLDPLVSGTQAEASPHLATRLFPDREYKTINKAACLAELRQAS